MRDMNAVEASDPAPGPSGEVRTADLEILVVEDDEADAYLIRKALKRIPRISQIVIAHDGVEALDLLDSGLFHPDVAIVDLSMPRMDGFSLLSEMRCRRDTEFPAIVLTSSKVPEDAYRSRLRGADRVLTKPASNEALERILSNAIASL